ncbi:MAG: sugar phosphate nucleotidyltransferase [Patescibacteria group bacterium]
MSNEKNHLIVILCGGTGPRLWPLSRANYPKQFLKIFSDNSILKETVLRARKIVNPNQVFLISNQKYLPLIKKDLDNLIDSKNIFLEPDKKNTTAAIIFTLAKLWSKHPEAIVSFLPSDHFIPTLSKFSSDINKCFSIASDSDNLVAIGIKATSPNPSYGYLLPQKKINHFYSVRKFIEKPNSSNALKLIIHGAKWNSGIYTAKIITFINEIKTHQPGFYQLFIKLISDPDNSANIKKLYQNAPALPFDRAISEKTKKLIYLPASFVWIDIGEWKSIYSKLPKLNKNFAVLKKNTQFLEVNSGSCLISGPENKLIGLVGVKNLAIIDTPDALLICNLTHNDCFNVRDLVKKITSNPHLIKYFSSDES